MKKLIFFVVLLAVIGAGGWGYYQHRLELTKEQEGKFSPNSADIYAGILEALQPTLQLHEYSLSMLVPGNRMGELKWNFRGTLGKENASPPFYGRLVYTCGLTGGDYCWQLEELVVDGRQLELVSSKVGKASPENTQFLKKNSSELAEKETPVVGEQNEDLVSNTVPEETSAGGSAPVAKASQYIAEEDVPAVRDEEAMLPVEDVEIWHTTSNTVNARMGPGTDYEIAFQMPTSTPLKLMEEQNGWGRFSYSGQDGKSYSVWVAMSLVESK